MDILIRDFPDKLKKELKRIAKEENLSLNRLILKAIKYGLDKKEEELRESKERNKVFENIRVIRERLQAKYGKFDDSAKLIREDRDSR